MLLLERDELVFPPDCPLVVEMKSFANIGGVRQAIAGQHDDAVMSAAIAFALLDRAIQPPARLPPQVVGFATW